jgi:TRAP-type transport system periplasmic protein
MTTKTLTGLVQRRATTRAVVCALICVAAMLSSCTAPDPSGAHVLSYASPYPPTHPFSRADIRWMKFVEERSAGRLRIKPFWGGSLLSSDQSVIEIRHGVADIGLITPIYMRGGMHASRAQAGFYGGVRSMEDQIAIFKCLAREFPVFGEELRGLRVLALQGGNSPGVLTRSRPVRSLADLQGMRLRAQSESIDVLRRLGADPVDMPMSEVYSALAKGVIDGVVAPVDALRSMHLAEVGSHFTELIFSRGSYPARAMSERSWQRLPADLQQVLEDSRIVWEQALTDEIGRAQQLGYDYAAESGIEFFNVAASEQRRFDAVATESAEDRARSLAAFGIDGVAIMQAVQRLINERAAGHTLACHTPLTGERA